MPWCDPCERFFNPGTLKPDGACPDCGEIIGALHDAASPASVGADHDAASPVSVGADHDAASPASVGADHDAQSVSTTEADRQGVPWHFWLLVAAAGCYILWRIGQLLARLFGG